MIYPTSRTEDSIQFRTPVAELCTLRVGEGQRENLCALFNRQRGQVFKVANGKLEIDKTWKGKARRAWHCLKCRATCKKTQTPQQKAVQDVVKQALEALENSLRNVEITENHQTAMDCFFKNGALARMSKHVFDRGVIKEGSQLEKSLHDFDEQRSELQKTFANWKSDPSIVTQQELEKAFLDLTFEEFQFAQSLGLNLERNGDGGTGGARYGLNRFGKKIWVIKPDDEGPHGVNNPRWVVKIKRIFGTQPICLKGNSEAEAEVESYEFDHKLRFKIVPPTLKARVTCPAFHGPKEKTCSLQMFVEGSTTLSEHLGFSYWKNVLPRRFLRWKFKDNQDLKDKVPVALMARVGAHNFGIEDLDCHSENLLVKTFKKEALSELPDQFFKTHTHQRLLEHLFHSERVGEEEIILIKHDGGSTAPHRHPLAFFETRFKHMFEVFPHFNEVFPEDVKALVQEKDEVFIKYLEEKTKRLLNSVISDPTVLESFWNEHRIDVLQWLFESDSNAKMRVEDALTLKTANQKYFKGTPLKKQAKIRKQCRSYYKDEMKRIQGCIRTRIDSWVLLVQAANASDPMRDLFEIRNGLDFEKRLDEDQHLVHDFNEKMSVYVKASGAE